MLILTSSFGGGHNSVAKAVKGALEENYSMSVSIEDLYHIMNPKLNSLNSKF